MFYIKQITPFGCLLWTALFVWLFIKLKLYYLVAFIILIAIIFHFYKKTKTRIEEYKEEQERNFEPEIGEVSKICPCCGQNVKRSAKTCPHCKASFE